ncbi:hypothetical protein NDU88_009072 [Pleurodeles waltl]|uniref:Clathrin heavy chain linker domain-containing protein 1 n=1 Tax=Pleurodeles waltl TaxID=8319 RepID=A0AAV7RYP8_PLEWA|nr:hypothetical protein NDU88_009072 [Pleurodeles waltl]
MSSATARLNKSPVLPPILSEGDRTFLKSIEKYIAEETTQLECSGETDFENIFVIYRNAFDKVIDYVTSYKKILTSIKQEYDNLINLIKRGQKDALYLNGKLKVLKSEPTTLMYYEKRATQLQDKIDIIEKDSTKILNQIRDIHVTKKTATVSSKKPRDVLGAHVSEEVESKLDSLCLPFCGRWIAKADLDQALELALKERDKAASKNTRLKLRYKRGNMIYAAITSWAQSDKRRTLPDYLYKVTTLEDASKEDDQMPPRVFEDDDPRIIKEADDLLEYIERFNELFEAGQYEAASILVSNCPRGVLRTMDTMERFKAVPAVEGKVPPLMLFFEALINSSSSVKDPVSASLTLEGIKCALMQKRLDLVIHWITQQRLTFSEALGDAIFEYGNTEHHNKAKCLALAQVVYRQCAVHRKTALCMCLEGRVCGVMEFIHHAKQFSLDDLLFLLKQCPSNELIQNLINEWNGKPAVLSIGQAVLLLISAGHKENGFQLLQQINVTGKSALKKAILSDEACTLEEWAEIADVCSKNNYIPLSQKIRSILTSQEGIVEFSSTDDYSEIMEHIYL